MKTGYSPYDMCNEAIRLIDLCMSTKIDTNSERQIILLLNKSESYPNMSAYQLSVARKKLADLYYNNGITGNALEQYILAQKCNSKIAVKKKVNELSKIPKSELIFSLDSNTIDEPDYSNLAYYESKMDDTFFKQRKEQITKIASSLNTTADELNRLEDNIRKQLQEEALPENKINDQEFEKELEERLSRLDKLSINAFYRTRAQRKNDDLLSNKELDLLTLEAMEKSYDYRNKK